jgi:ATP-binding cassette subfamily F protein 3
MKNSNEPEPTYRALSRFRAKASKAKQAKSRIKALEKMELIAAVQESSSFNFSFPEPPKTPAILFKLSDVAIGYGDKTILQGLNWRIDAGARIGLLGPNGAGKSTLIKLLAGSLRPSHGERETGKDLHIGYYAQHQLEQLVVAESPLQHLSRLAPTTTEQKLRSFLGGFGFSDDTALTPIAQFSGGEKARLALALIVWQKPNLLLLDEPTNHLDLNMRTALTLALQHYTGAVIVVSHDRYLLRTTVEQFMLVANNQLMPFDGDLEDYQQWLTSYRQEQSATPGQPKVKPNRKQERESARQLDMAIKRLERTINSYHAELQTVTEDLAKPEIYQPGQEAKLAEYLAKQTHLQQQLTVAESEWLALNERLET